MANVVKLTSDNLDNIILCMPAVTLQCRPPQSLGHYSIIDPLTYDLIYDSMHSN